MQELHRRGVHHRAAQSDHPDETQVVFSRLQRVPREPGRHVRVHGNVHRLQGEHAVIQRLKRGAAEGYLVLEQVANEAVFAEAADKVHGGPGE